MDYKEKVKAYDELFVKAKQIYNKENDVLIMHTIEDLFPELKESEGESEDEKIRKQLIQLFQSDNEESFGEFTNKQFVSWLEKQGEQIDIANKEYWRGYREGKKEILDKYAEAEKQSEKKHKFNIGDIISNGQAVFRIENITKNCIGQDCYFLVNVEDEKKGLRYLILTDSQGNRSHFGEITWLCEQVDKSFEKQGEHKVEPKFEIGDWVINRTNAIIMQIVNNKDFYESVEIDGQRRTDSYNYADWDFRLWTIQDAKDGDVLAFKNDISGIIICKSPTDYDTRSYCRLASDNLINKEESGWDSTLLVPATKEQHDLLFQEMKKAGYEWDAENKELKKIEQKSACSEDNLSEFESYLCLLFQKFRTKGMCTNGEIIDYVKEHSQKLKDALCHHWTEDDERMYNGLHNLIYVIHNCDCDSKEKLKFSNWLKSLKGRVQLKQEWSEEDSIRLQRIIDFLWYNRKGDTDTIYQQEQDIDWLKSLRPQPQWKPSEEQLNNILDVLSFDNCTPKRQELLISLYEQLKKLK